MGVSGLKVGHVTRSYTCDRCCGQDSLKPFLIQKNLGEQNQSNITKQHNK